MITDATIVDGSHPGQWCSLPCRSIRIGNYKVLPKEKITITTKGVQIKVPAIINTNEVVTINIPMSDVLKVLAHFGKSMPLLFLYISPAACLRARKILKMTNSQSFYLDVQSNDETQKRITILPEKLTEDNKAILKQHFGSNMQELGSKDANEILVRSSPEDLSMLKRKMGGVNSGEKRPCVKLELSAEEFFEEEKPHPVVAAAASTLLESLSEVNENASKVNSMMAGLRDQVI